MKTRTLGQLVKNLQEKHAELNSWPKTSVACDVLTEDGRPDPALAQRIATKGYDPKRPETRQRLGLPEACITCGQKVKRVRHVPAWLDEAVKNLRELEAKTDHAPQPIWVYGRGGKRIRYVDPGKPS